MKRSFITSGPELCVSSSGLRGLVCDMRLCPFLVILACFSDADPEEGQGVRNPPEKSQKYRVSYQYWSGSPENHKATKPAFNVGPSSLK